MSKEHDAAFIGEASNASAPPPLQPSADWMLQTLVGLVNTGPISMGITLSVGGALVSGTLIGGREYFEGIAEQLCNPSPSSDALVAQAIANGMRKLSEIYSQPREAGEELEKDAPGPSYIHLKNARMYISGSRQLISNAGGVWWRGKLSAVDGFAFGELTIS